jgi:hypothetical protein
MSFKKDEHNIKSNYRLCPYYQICLKFAKKSFLFAFYNYLVEIGFLHNLQSGFRPGHSTVLQLTYVVHQIYSSLEDGKK